MLVIEDCHLAILVIGHCEIVIGYFVVAFGMLSVTVSVVTLSAVEGILELRSISAYY